MSSRTLVTHSRPALPQGVLSLFATARVRAWGAGGHRITGDIATALLTPGTRSQLRGLIGSDELALVSNYMDEERAALAIRYPGSPTWHYDDRPACESGVSYADYCRDGRCATAQVAAWLKLLADAQAAPEQRAFAIKLVVHVVSDLHQPLHAAN